MRLLVDPSERKTEFKRLMENYSEYYLASAWATVGFDLFDFLMKNKERIKKMVVGVSFDHTHPEFIRTFIKEKNIRFFKKPGTLFHPKIYLFKEGSNWEMIMGSMNFTSAGFNDNVETLLLISCDEDNSSEIFNKSINLFEQIWNDASYFSEDELSKYEEAYKNQQKRLGEYVINKPGKLVSHVKIMNLSWSDFFSQVKDEKTHGLQNRINVLNGARQFFKENHSFYSMTYNQRKAIAGFLGEKDGVNWNFFGGTGSGKFMHMIRINEPFVSDALDKIPIEGELTRRNFFDFITEFKKGGGKNMISSASRLLAMKRPDIFVCLNERNNKKLCKYFGISQNGMTYERYWDDIIERILDSDWWNSPPPKNPEELSVWKGRSAFLDSISYEEKEDKKLKIVLF